MHRYDQDERRVRRTNRAHRWWLVIIAVISAAAAALLVLLAQAQRGGWRTEAKAQPQVVVTAGGSSYHRINCRTVEGHEVRALTIAEARRLAFTLRHLRTTGLTPLSCAEYGRHNEEMTMELKLSARENSGAETPTRSVCSSWWRPDLTPSSSPGDRHPEVVDEIADAMRNTGCVVSTICSGGRGASWPPSATSVPLRSRSEELSHRRGPTRRHRCHLRSTDRGQDEPHPVHPPPDLSPLYGQEALEMELLVALAREIARTPRRRACACSGNR